MSTSISKKKKTVRKEKKISSVPASTLCHTQRGEEEMDCEESKWKPVRCIGAGYE